jgi:sodium transport system permease protein
VKAASLWRAVFRKEFVDNARDRRALSTALLFPLLGPFSLYLIFLAFMDAHEKTTSPRVPLIGREYAPTMVAELERDGLSVVAAPEDPVAAVRRGDVDIVVVIPPSFGEDLRAARPAVIELIADESRTQSQATIAAVKHTLLSYGQRLGAMRLLARGVDPGVVAPLSVAMHDVGTAKARAAVLLGSLPMFLLLGCFIGGTYIAIDTTAGERERGSLEALLLNPVPPWILVAGKLSATFVFSVASIVVTAAGFVVAAAVIPFSQAGMTLDLPPVTALAMVAMLVPVALLGSAIQIFVGTLSKTFKTAQAAISVVTMAPAIPATLLALFPQKPSLALLALPTVGHSVLMDLVLRGEAVGVVDVLVAIAAVLVAAGLVAGATTRLFGPRLLSGR